MSAHDFRNPAAYQHMEMHQTAANHAPPAVVVVARSAVPPVPQQLRVQMQEHHHVQAQPAVVPMAAVQSSVSSVRNCAPCSASSRSHTHTSPPCRSKLACSQRNQRTVNCGRACEPPTPSPGHTMTLWSIVDLHVCICAGFSIASAFTFNFSWPQAGAAKGTFCNKCT